MSTTHTMPRLEEQDVHAMVQEFIELVARLAKEAGVSVELKPGA